MRHAVVMVWAALGCVGADRVALAKVHKASAPAKPADPAPQAPPEPEEPQVKHRQGPDTVKLPNDLTVALPEGYLLFEKPEAAQIMERMGNLSTDTLLALITKPQATWFVTVRYEDEGYVKDDDAEKLDADEILSSIREGTEAANEERQKRGFDPVHVEGWTDKPRYERGPHHLVWGIKGSSKNGNSVNFNTRILGRKGFVSLNLIDDAQNIEASKPEVAPLLQATTFDRGSRYADFDAGKDKVAEYGLAALVAGGAGALALKAAKIGLLAKFGGKLVALLIAGKKLVVLAIVAIGAFLRRLFGRKKAAPVAATPAGAAPPPSDEPPAP